MREGVVPDGQEVSAMLKVAEGLRDHFKALLKANEKPWLQGYAETSHWRRRIQAPSGYRQLWTGRPTEARSGAQCSEIAQMPPAMTDRELIAQDCEAVLAAHERERTELKRHGPDEWFNLGSAGSSRRQARC
jgi:hypothetical protein